MWRLVVIAVSVLLSPQKSEEMEKRPAPKESHSQGSLRSESDFLISKALLVVGGERMKVIDTRRRKLLSIIPE